MYILVFVFARAKWVRQAKRYHIYVTTFYKAHANLQLAVKVTVNLQNSFTCMELTLYPKNHQSFTCWHTISLICQSFFANSFFRPFAKVFHHQSFPLYSKCLIAILILNYFITTSYLACYCLHTIIIHLFLDTQLKLIYWLLCWKLYITYDSQASYN